MTAFGNATSQSSGQSSSSQGRIPELDGLRGLAILLVLLYHYIALAGDGDPGTSLYAFRHFFIIGWTGVDLFFVLSGFLIGGILLESRESPVYYQAFYARRFWRIIPLYGLWVGAFFVMVLLSFPGFPALLAENPEKWSDARFYFLFVQNSVKLPRGLFGTAWLGQMWSLAVEEQFYLLIPLVVRLVSRRRLVHWLCLAVVFAPISRMVLLLFVPQYQAAPNSLTVCRADALAWGVLLACVVRDNQWRSRLLQPVRLAYAVIPVLLIAVGYLAVVDPPQYSAIRSVWGYSFTALFFTSLLGLALANLQGAWAWFCRRLWLAHLGRVSFCIYVIHQAVNLLCHLVLRGAAPAFDSVASIMVTGLAAGLTFAIAQLSWKFFECPLIRKGHELAYTYAQGISQSMSDQPHTVR